MGRELLERLTELEEEVEKRTRENERLLKDFQDRNQEALDEMLKARETFDGETRLLRENVQHLEVISLDLIIYIPGLVS